MDAGELTNAGDAHRHCETDVYDGIADQDDRGSIHALAGTFARGDVGSEIRSRRPGRWGGFRIYVPGSSYFDGSCAVRRDQASEIFHLEADVDEEDAVDCRERKHVDEKED